VGENVSKRSWNVLNQKRKENEMKTEQLIPILVDGRRSFVKVYKEILGMKRNSVGNAILQGRLDAHQLSGKGSRYVIRMDAINAYKKLYGNRRKRAAQNTTQQKFEFDNVKVKKHSVYDIQLTQKEFIDTIRKTHQIHIPDDASVYMGHKLLKKSFKLTIRYTEEE
jgi:hypothetical protein